MSAIVSVKSGQVKDTYVIEVDAGRGNWLPKVGEVFYAPNLLSMATPVADFDWTGSPSDFRLASMRMVHRTYEEALEHYNAQVRLQCVLVI